MVKHRGCSGCGLLILYRRGQSYTTIHHSYRFYVFLSIHNCEENRWHEYIFIDRNNKKNPKTQLCMCFRKKIYSADGRSLPVATLRQKSKNIILPFPPYVGLSVSDHIVYGENKEDEEYIEFHSGKI